MSETNGNDYKIVIIIRTTTCVVNISNWPNAIDLAKGLFTYVVCCVPFVVCNTRQKTFFFSNTRAAYHCIKTKQIGTIFGYNPDGTNSKWTQAGKPAEHNPKDKLPHELLTSRTT